MKITYPARRHVAVAVTVYCLNALFPGLLFTAPRSDAQEMFINPGLNGSWFQPQHDLQGIVVEVVPVAKELFVYWFTYNDEGAPLWLVGNGPIESDQVVLGFLDMAGGRLADASPATVNSWGNGRIVFSSCFAAELEFTSFDGLQQGVIELQRIHPAYGCLEELGSGSSQYLRAASGSAFAMNGIWSFSGCEPAAGGFGTSFETFEFLNNSVSLNLVRHQTANCSDAATQIGLEFEFSFGPEQQAILAGESVLATRVQMINGGTGEATSQIFYVDDRVSPARLYHGVFADDGGTVNDAGYPTQLHSAHLVKQ